MAVFQSQIPKSISVIWSWSTDKTILEGSALPDEAELSQSRAQFHVCLKEEFKAKIRSQHWACSQSPLRVVEMISAFFKIMDKGQKIVYAPATFIGDQWPMTSHTCGPYMQSSILMISSSVCSPTISPLNEMLTPQ